MADDGTPYAALCFAVLAFAYTVVIVVIFAVEQFQATAEAGGVMGRAQALIPTDGRAREFVDMMQKAFSPENLANAKSAMNLVPTVSVLMLFVMLRARDQQIFDNDPKYQTVQVGMAWATFGLIILALDALTIRVMSDILGNLSQSVGTTVLTLSFAILLWGVFVVHDEYHDLSTAAKALAALSIPVIGCLLIIKGLQFWQFWNPLSLLPTQGQTVFDKLNGIITEEKILEIQSAASFAPMMLIAFFYSHFEHLGSTPASNTEVDATILCVVGVYLQALVAFLRASTPPTEASWYNHLTAAIKTLSLIFTYAAFVIVLYSALKAGPTSDAAFCLLLILVVIAILKLLIVAIMEGKRYVIDMVDEGNVEWATNRAEELTKLFKDMMNAAALGEILCIILAYLHLRPKIILSVDPQGDLDSRWGLLPAIVVSTVSIFVLMGVLVINFFVSEPGSVPAKVSSLLQSGALLFVNLGLFATTIHVIG